MSRWTGAFITQQVIMSALWYGVIRYMIWPTILDLRKELQR